MLGSEPVKYDPTLDLIATINELRDELADLSTRYRIVCNERDEALALLADRKPASVGTEPQ
jgi:hypothetical protein